MNQTKWNPTATMMLILACIVPGASLAQDKSQSKDTAIPTIRSQTNVVLVPVVVTDKQGQHITGLTADDFELKQDGTSQKISNLDEVSAEPSIIKLPSLPPNVFTNQVAVVKPKKLAIIALDLVNNPFATQADAKRHLIEFLQKSTVPDTLIALVVFAQPNGMRVIHNFTSDPSVLVAALKKVQSTITSRDAVASDSAGDSDIEASQIMSILASPGAYSGDVRSQIAQGQAGLSASRNSIDLSRQTSEGLFTLECIQQVAQYFGGIPGRKSLIWASTGIRFTVGSVTGSATGGATLSDWERTAHMLQDGNIAVYPVDVGGLVAGVGMKADISNAVNLSTLKTTTPEGGINARGAGMDAASTGAFLDPTQAKHETMRTVADLTGGQAYYNFNNAEELFRRAAEDSAQYYLLTFPAKDTGKNGWRKLSLKVHRDGTQVRYRTGYFYSNPTRDPDTLRKSDEIAALASGLNITTLPIIGQWQQTEPAGDQRKVHFLLQIPPGIAYIDTDHENQVNIDFIVIALDSKGKEVTRISQRVDRKLPPAGVSQIEAQGVNYGNTLTVPPGQYSVRIVVRDNLKGATGSLTAVLKVE